MSGRVASIENKKKSKDQKRREKTEEVQRERKEADDTPPTLINPVHDKKKGAQQRLTAVAGKFDGTVHELTAVVVERPARPRQSPSAMRTKRVRVNDRCLAIRNMHALIDDTVAANSNRSSKEKKK